MATETRSHHGCWSCRLRKKKCDERHPICTECMCVGLECHGFGEKPEWMDRGARQKAQAAKMKQKVAQVTKSRRMNQIRDQHESSMKRQQKQSNTSTNQDDNPKRSDAEASSRSRGNSTPTGSAKDSIHVQVHVPNSSSLPENVFRMGDTLGQDTTAGSTHEDKMQFSTPSSYHHDGLSVTMDALAGIDTTTLTGFASMSLPSFHDLDFLSDHHFEVDMDLPDLDTDNSVDGLSRRLGEEVALGDLNLTENLHMGYSAHHTVQVGAIKTITPTPTPTPIHTPHAMDFSTAWPGNMNNMNASANMSMLQITNIEDAILFANYLDKVFRWQFPFCTSGERDNEFNQGHYIWLMSRSRPLYLASLALSSSYSRLSPKNGSADGFHAASYPPPTYAEAEDQRTGYGTGYGAIGTERYDIATQELQQNLKATPAPGPTPADDVAMLACIVSFITSSFLHPTQIDWNAHLKAGTSLIAPWIDRQLQQLQHQQRFRDASGKTLHDYLPNLNTTEESARIFFTTSIIRFDILSSLTSDSAPALSESYKQLLAQSPATINLEPVSGCQSWVFSILLDVYSLRDWKRTTRAAGLLSLWELTYKANTIQTELEARIADNQNTINNLHEKSRNTSVKDAMEMDMDTPSTSPSETHHAALQSHLITQSFASAVSVLLEVIVSGAYPQLPEIKHKVARALEAFTEVSSHSGQELVEASLGCPLFVVGCVIDEEHYILFRNLLSPMHRSRTRARSIPTPISPVGSGMGNMMGMGMGMGMVKGASHDRRLSGVLELLERCWRGRETGEVRDDGFDYSHFGRGGRGGDDGSFKGCDFLVA